MSNHHFDNKDTIQTYMGRCIRTKMSLGSTRSESFSACFMEYKCKKQKKQLK